VSAVDRHIDGWRYLQVDAAINPGNSGGQLYGENGELLGIVSCSRLESQGLNFAVPGDVVYGKFNAYLEERSRGGLHTCTVCGTASRDPRYCKHCGSLIALIEAADEKEGALLRRPQAAWRAVLCGVWRHALSDFVSCRDFSTTCWPG
jgi:serine protease Do